MYLIDCFDPEFEVNILRSSTIRTTLQIADFLEQFTSLDVDGRVAFLQRLRRDGIAEHIHGDDNNGRWFDVTVMFDATYREPLMDAVRRITLENAK